VSRVAPGELPGPAVDAVFRADVTKLPAYAGADLGPEGYAVYAIGQVREGGRDQAAATARVAQLAERVAQASAQSELSALVDTLKARAKVVRHEERLGKGEPR
jgi:peptidyl-prolyl cis-trans isomerase D